PVFFPGGDIGKLAVNGTVNDLAVMGARPLYLSCALILEEGLAIADLKTILESMKRAADYAGVKIVTGDTKVVQKGNADRIFINTAGIGVMEREVQRREIAPGDRIIVNGSIGDHGVAVMAERNRLTFTRGLASDCAPLNHLVARVMEKFPGAVRFMRDATRGGVASVLNEIVKNRGFSAILEETVLPVKEEVKGVCDLLGIEPLYVANEGKLVIVADAASADGIVEEMRRVEEGRGSCVIGTVSAEFPGKVIMETEIGGRRILPLLAGEQLPRIC
ncbi:MAG TPA: hydrogenase expression/formation protein HypE, partial [Spirochaetota bacterium]|nr:hydrogenase expression/formation protein HypE [Spirochaetota bacterium]